jgi:predicted phage tail protein
MGIAAKCWGWTEDGSEPETIRGLRFQGILIVKEPTARVSYLLAMVAAALLMAGVIHMVNRQLATDDADQAAAQNAQFDK